MQLFRQPKVFVAAALLLNMFFLQIPTAKAQDIEAVCGLNPEVKNLTTKANSLPGADTANAQLLIGFQAVEHLSSVGTGTFLSGILSSNIIPIAGQIITAAYVAYMVINKLRHRAPLPGPGALTRGPEGYALVGIGFGSDDRGCWYDLWEGELQPDGSVVPIPRNFSNRAEQRRSCWNSGGNDGGKFNGQYAVYVPKDKYAVGWTFVPSRTDGGRPYRDAPWVDNFPPNSCFFQMFRKVDPATGMLVGPILGWSGAGDPGDNLNPADYNGSCDERGYGGGFDLKSVKLVSDLPDPSNSYSRQGRTACNSPGTDPWNTCQGDAPVVDFPFDPPPSRRVIIGMRFELDNDADVGKICLAFNNSGKITVRSRKVEDPDTDLGLPFDLQGPTAAPPGSNTLYQNGNSAFGSYSLTVPPGTAALYPGYTCGLRLVDSSIDQNNPTSLLDTGDSIDCNSTLLGELDAIKSPGADGTEFIIEFDKGGCVPKSCGTVVANGAQCGKFPDGCNLCNPTSSDPTQTAGCLDCGSCGGAGAVCTAEGKCSANFDASCTISPATLFVGESAGFNVQTANGTEPYACAWQSADSQINGKNTCTFSETFATPGTRTAAVTVTDSSNPTKTKTAQCTLTVNPPITISPPPVPIVPNYSLCEIYKVLILYGVPLFAIMIVIAGLYILMSLGDPSRVTKGKQALSAGVGGLLVLLLAKPIFMIIITFLGFSVVLCGTVIP